MLHKAAKRPHSVLGHPFSSDQPGDDWLAVRLCLALNRERVGHVGRVGFLYRKKRTSAEAGLKNLNLQQLDPLTFNSSALFQILPCRTLGFGDCLSK